MKRLMHALNGIALIATLFSMQARAEDALPVSSVSSVLPASAQTPAGAHESLVNGDSQNVQMTLANVAALDLQRGPSRMDYADIPAARVVPAPAPAASAQKSAAATEPDGEIWMFLGAITIAFMIAWRRCRWASLRGGSAISTGQRSPSPPQHRTASPIGLSAGHGHLPFGG